MGHDVICIHDPSDCHSEPTLDDLMGELIGESHSESVSLINYSNQLDEVLSRANSYLTNHPSISQLF